MALHSRKLGWAVFQTLVCAKYAATAQQIIAEIGEFNPHKDVKSEVKTVSQAAYAIAAHAWIAMMAMDSNNLEIAQNAAQAAARAKQDILMTSRHCFLLNFSVGQTSYTHMSIVPDRHRLLPFLTQ